MSLLFNWVFGRLRNKILLAFSVLLTAGVASVVWVSTSLTFRDSMNSAYAAAAEISKGLLIQFEQEVFQAQVRSRFWVMHTQETEKLTQLVQGDPNIGGIALLNIPERKIEVQAYNSALSSLHANPKLNLTPEEIEVIAGKFSLEEETEGLFYQVQKIGDQNFHQISQALVVEGGKLQKVLLTFLDSKPLTRSFEQAGVYEKFLFDSEGKILLRSFETGGLGAPVDSTFPKEFMAPILSAPKQFNNTQIRWVTAGEMGQPFIGHTYRSQIPGLNVAVLSPTVSLLETVYAVARRSVYLGLAILSLALVFGTLFSDSIVKPLIGLLEGTLRISKGDFSFRLKAQSQDEVSRLTNAFNSMAEGLAERERIKEVFGKFHSKAVFQKLLKEDRIRLGGERLPVTVFFSDIRSFTSKSEAMTPEQVVEMLNEYMSEMVSVIEKYGGVVDKYVGDAIMAIWGMPEPNPAVDAENALRACLEMREKLAELNEKRKSRGQDLIEIGMGLNSGEVIAGNIGSPSRMEYTVIGDTVNTASRMESLTKEFKTDLLVSETTQNLIIDKNQFAFEGPFEAHAKGKAEKVQIFGCSGPRANQVLDAA